MPRKTHPVSVLEATQQSPNFKALIDLAEESTARLSAVLPLIPTTLQPSIQAGPIEGSSWCLILNNAAAAGKLRQLLPSLEAHLRVKGWEVSAIRLKIQMSHGKAGP
jgi:hypothetical protein